MKGRVHFYLSPPFSLELKINKNMNKSDLQAKFEKLAKDGQFGGLTFGLSKGQKLKISNLDWLDKPLTSRSGSEYYALVTEDGFAVSLRTLCRVGSGITKDALLNALRGAFNGSRFSGIEIMVDDVLEHQPYNLYTFSLK